MIGFGDSIPVPWGHLASMEVHNDFMVCCDWAARVEVPQVSGELVKGGHACQSGFLTEL